MAEEEEVGHIDAKKWIGGITISDALQESERLNGNGEKVIVNYLGEDLIDPAKVKKTVNIYFGILKGMREKGIRGSIAVKPTQLGLNINYATFLSNYEKIVDYADKMGRLVWMDMEDYMTVDNSIRAYLLVIKRHRNAGICIQSKLMRSLSDIRLICKKGGIVRLVKGAYAARKGITYAEKIRN